MALLLPLFIFAAFYVFTSIRVVPEYERLVVLTLGRLTGQRGPGLTFIFGPFQKAHRLSLRTITMEVPPQEIVTRDSVTLKVAAACFWRVNDPIKAIMSVQSYSLAVGQIAQTALRASLSKNALDDILGKQSEIAEHLKAFIDRQTEAWGVEIEAVELKDIELPDNLKRALAREAEAERERRAKIIAARGENEAASILVDAADKLQKQPISIQLRWLETLLAISAENNSVVIPIPVDLMGTVLGRAVQPALMPTPTSAAPS